MVAQRTHRSPAPNPAIITEAARPGSFLVSIYAEAHCHENAVVAGGVDGVKTNSVLVDGTGKFQGIVYEGVPAGQSAMRALLVRGPAEVTAAELNWPVALDGPDAGPDAVAETAALRASLVDDMTEAGIVVRD